jgi:hypothetical protein
MRCCISNAVLRNSITLEVQRPGQSDYDEKGRYQEAAKETIYIKGAVQPLSPKELLQETDSRKVKEAIKIYTTDDLRTVSIENSIQPDIVIYKDVEYEVHSVGDWTSFKKVVATRREQ